MATATKALVICWTVPSTASDEQKVFLTAFKARLEGAGYDLTSRVCDIDFAYGFGWREEAGDKYWREVTLVVSDGSGEVEKIKLEFEGYDFPLDKPDRLAIVLVNRLNASDTLAKLARERESGEKLRKSKPDCLDDNNEECRPSKSKNLIQAPR